MTHIASLICLMCIQSAAIEWQTVETGLMMTSIGKDPEQVLVLRIDPRLWSLTMAGPPEKASGGMTAKHWAQQEDLVVAINAGMFATDYLTHVGYLEHDGVTRSQHVNHYQSVAAFNPRNPMQTPPFTIFDLDDSDVSIESIRAEYTSLVQNLRLVKKPAINRWSPQERRWSEAALGEDIEGNVLFVFSRAPYAMHELNELLIEADIGLVALQHLEGGPEAQLYMNAGGHEIELFGSYETGFREDDDNAIPWPIPNVIGIRSRQPSVQH